MKEETPSKLSSPVVLVALFLLLLNDFLLKFYLHNSLTGKLSDFAGLFVFPLFWTVLFPRFRLGVYLATAGFFIFWKSHASATFINTWNDLGLFSAGRTVDYTDLLALMILPLSYFYGLRAEGLVSSRAVPVLIGIVSVFAFTATSFSHKTQYGKEFPFALSKQELRERMSRLPRKDVSQLFWEADDFTVSIEPCLEANFSIEERDDQSVLILRETDYRCPTPPSKEKMLKTFEDEVIARLTENPISTPSKIRWILPHPKFPSPSPTKAQSRNPRNSQHENSSTR